MLLGLWKSLNLTTTKKLSQKMRFWLQNPATVLKLDKYKLTRVLLI